MMASRTQPASEAPSREPQTQPASVAPSTKRRTQLTAVAPAIVAIVTIVGVGGLLYATRGVLDTLGRVGIVASLLGAIALIAWGAATMMTSRPRAQTWSRAIASAIVLVAVAIGRAPLVLSGLVGVAAALSLADTIGMLRAPKLTERAGSRAVALLGGVFEVGYRVGFVLLFALVTAYKVAPDRVTGAIRALFPPAPTIASPPAPIRVRTLDAAVAPADVPTSPRVLIPLPPATPDVLQQVVPPRRLEAGSPTETSDGVGRWLAQTDAARELQRKMETLQQQNPGARITRTISRQNECGFVITFPDGRTEGWLYDSSTHTVVRAEWDLRGPAAH